MFGNSKLRLFRININCNHFREGVYVKSMLKERAITLGEYIIENNATVRGAAVEFNVSKSTVHKDVAQRLKNLDPELYREVKMVLDTNKKERHIRGGLATRRKYKGE